MERFDPVPSKESDPGMNALRLMPIDVPEILLPGFRYDC
jgi:hypothetical protein